MSNTAVAGKPSVLLLRMVAGSKPAMSPAVSMVMAPPGCAGSADGDVEVVADTLSRLATPATGAFVAAGLVTLDFLAVVGACVVPLVADGTVVVAPAATVVCVAPI